MIRATFPTADGFVVDETIAWEMDPGQLSVEHWVDAEVEWDSVELAAFIWNSEQELSCAGCGTFEWTALPLDDE